jgi:pilus assembly protein CpaC
MMLWNRSGHGLGGTFTTLLGLCLLSALPCFAAGPGRIGINPTELQKVAVTAGKSVIIESPVVMRRVSVAAPNIADALVLTPRQVYLTGKGPGITNLTVWNENDTVGAIFDVEVLPDVARLKAGFHEMFPEEKDIRVTATNDGITLTGTVSSTTKLSQVSALAEPYAPVNKEGKPKVINLLEVGGVHQVMLEVRVSEMDKTLIRNLGINLGFVSASGNQFGLSLLDGLTKYPSTGSFPANPLSVSTNINMITSFRAAGASWTGFIDALKDEELLKVLAEPTLITLSGKPANFLAGGEFPVPVPQPSAAGTIVTIQYKPFGIGLNFTPTVLSNNRISMLVAPEVSELDFTTAVSFAGFVIPSITTRRVSTTVELADGQSFAIAGLLKDEVRQSVRKFPLLGDIPILGALFRSTAFQKDETELVIIVTPHLVKPVDMTKQTLPTDQLIDPDDFEFYLLGKLEGTTGADDAAHTALPGTRRGGLEGDFGHIVP